jgi:hypothetical protein
LEVWLIGTPAELDTALTLLAEAGHTAYQATRRRLTGADHGRWQIHLRITVPLTKPTTPPPAEAAALIEVPRRAAA